MERRTRRSFTPEFKAEAVRQVREGGKSMPQVVKELDLTESALRNRAGVKDLVPPTREWIVVSVTRRVGLPGSTVWLL